MDALGSLFSSGAVRDTIKAQWDDRFASLSRTGQVEFPVRLKFKRAFSGLIIEVIKGLRDRTTVDKDSRRAFMLGLAELVDEFEHHMQKQESDLYAKKGVDVSPQFFALSRREKENLQSFVLFLFSRFLRDEHEYTRHKLYESSGPEGPGEAKR